CLSEHHITPATLDGPAQHADDLWDEEQATLADWLEGQPKPLAVLAANDARAWHGLCAARARKLGVPEEVAGLGVADTDPLCALAAPPLSSVALPVKQIGYAAAALLERLMKNDLPGAPGERDLHIEPVSVITRRSTDVLALED